MKRKFGMLLVLSTALILTSCGDKTNPLKDAADYYYQTLKDDTTSLKSYELNSKLVVAGVTYTVSWELTVVSGDAENVTLGAVNDKGMYPVTVVYDPLESTEEVKYTLKATLTDAEGNTEVLSFDRSIPAFKYATLADFKKAVKNSSSEVLNVAGVVTAVYKSGVYVQNEAGEGFYAYKPDFSPMTQEALFAEYPIGTEVIVSGTATSYSGQLEFAGGCAIKKMAAPAANFKLTYADKTEAYTNYSSTNDSVADLVNSLVEIKGATLGKIDEANYYYYFTAGSNEYYVRTSGSFNDFNTTEGDPKCVNNIVAEWQNGYTANIRGLASIYGGKYYITPVEMDAIEITGRQLTDETKLELALEEASDLFKNAFASNQSVTLPATATAEAINTVALSYTLSEDTPAANFAIADGKLNVTIPQDGNDVTGKITVTASVGGKTQSATYDIVAKFPTPSTIAAFLSAKDKDNSVFLQGVVTSDNKSEGSGKFVLSDSTGSVYCHNGAEVNLGDEIVISAKYTDFNALAQLTDVKVVKVVSTNNDYVAKSGTATKVTGVEIQSFIKAQTGEQDAVNAAIVNQYSGKLLEVEAYLYKSGNYTNAAATEAEATAGTSVLNLYPNDAADYSSLLGQKVLVTGFMSGFSTSKAYLNFMVQNIVAAGSEGGENPGVQPSTPEQPSEEPSVEPNVPGEFTADVTADYTGTTTTNLAAEGDSNATNLGLDASQWTITATKQITSKGQNFPGLNKDGGIRIYASAEGEADSKISFTLKSGTVKAIKITLKADSKGVYAIVVGGVEVTGTDGVFEINAASFDIVNVDNSQQVRIEMIEIDLA